MIRLTAISLAGIVASSMAASPCSDVFNAGIGDVRVPEVCNFMKTFEKCVFTLGGEEKATELATLVETQIRFGCKVAAEHSVERRQANGDADVYLNERAQPVVSRTRKETVSIFELNSDVEAVKATSRETSQEAAQMAKDIDQARADLNTIRVDMATSQGATLTATRIDERVKVMAGLRTNVENIEKDVITTDATIKATKVSFTNSGNRLAADIAKDQKSLQDSLEAKLVAATQAADAAKKAVASASITSESLPKGTVVQAVVRKNENTGGGVCDQGYCTDVPHYGNRIDRFRKATPYVEITAKRDNSHFQFHGSQYVYTIGGSHFYFDYKRTVNGGSAQSWLSQERKSTITDQIVGGHPNRWLGITLAPTFLDVKANAKKGSKVRYTLWVASWSGGRLYLQGYPNNNERALNIYTLAEIAA
jgi:hypothetical protein